MPFDDHGLMTNKLLTIWNSKKNKKSFIYTSKASICRMVCKMVNCSHVVQVCSLRIRMQGGVGAALTAEIYRGVICLNAAFISLDLIICMAAVKQIN